MEHHLDEGDCAVGVVDRLHHGLRGDQVRDVALGGGHVVVLQGSRRHLVVLEGVQQVLTPVLAVAVLHNGAQCLRPRHLGGHLTQ